MIDGRLSRGRFFRLTQAVYTDPHPPKRHEFQRPPLLTTDRIKWLKATGSDRSLCSHTLAAAVGAVALWPRNPVELRKVWQKACEDGPNMIRSQSSHRPEERVQPRWLVVTTIPIEGQRVPLCNTWFDRPPRLRPWP